MEESKARYREFCRHNYVPLQLQPWWLDAVCGAPTWGAALATDAGGQITGIMPWYRKRRLGLQFVQPPPFTSYAGPWLNYPKNEDFKRQSRYSFEKKVMNELIRQLPPSTLFIQQFRPEIENWLPFYWSGFRQSTRYTFVFDKIHSMEQVTAGMKNTLRTDLKKAELMTQVYREDDAFQLLFQMNPALHEQHIFSRLHGALLERNQMACFIARGRADGEAQAGLYLVFDDRQAAILLTATSQKHKSSSAVYGLILAAVEHCFVSGRSLDFEGSMLENVEATFRAWGARMQPYHRVWKPGNLAGKFISALYRIG